MDWPKLLAEVERDSSLSGLRKLDKQGVTGAELLKALLACAQVPTLLAGMQHPSAVPRLFNLSGEDGELIEIGDMEHALSHLEMVENALSSQDAQQLKEEIIAAFQVLAHFRSLQLAGSGSSAVPVVASMRTAFKDEDAPPNGLLLGFRGTFRGHFLKQSVPHVSWAWAGPVVLLYLIMATILPGMTILPTDFLSLAAEVLLFIYVTLICVICATMWRGAILCLACEGHIAIIAEEIMRTVTQVQCKEIVGCLYIIERFLRVACGSPYVRGVEFRVFMVAVVALLPVVVGAMAVCVAYQQ